MKIASKTLIFIIISIITVYVPLKIFDLMMASHGGSNLGFDVTSDKKTINTVDLYPYEGFHVQPNFHEYAIEKFPEQSDPKGPVKKHLVDIKTGDKGFFIDFDLANPPPKNKDEFRIILIGGSGAQGWGATSNDTMMYKLLPKIMNDSKNYNKKITLINLAMASAHAYQSFIMLNRYAHNLDPDLILCFCGKNDITVPTVGESNTDAFLFFTELNALAIAPRASVVPPILRPVQYLFPNIMTRTNIGTGLKIATGYVYLKQQGITDYQNITHQHYLDANEAIDKMAIPMFVNAMKSIKRDFNGVPIVVVWQPVAEKQKRELYNLGFKEGFYENAFQRIPNELKGYYNDYWWFMDIDSLVKGRKDGVYTVHMDDAAQKVVAKMIADQIYSDNIITTISNSRSLNHGMPETPRVSH